MHQHNMKIENGSYKCPLFFFSSWAISIFHIFNSPHLERREREIHIGGMHFSASIQQNLALNRDTVIELQLI